MTLRADIRQAIVSGMGDADIATIAVLRLLNNQLSLDGNGWFDDDPEALRLMYPQRNTSQEPRGSSQG